MNVGRCRRPSPQRSTRGQANRSSDTKGTPVRITNMELNGEPVLGPATRDGRISLEPTGNTEFTLTLRGVAPDEELAILDLLRCDPGAQRASLVETILESMRPDGPTAGSSRPRVQFSARVNMPGAIGQVGIIEPGQSASTIVECQAIAPSGEMVTVHLPLVFQAEVV